MMENIAGYLAAGLIGVSLGLIGGGGSIITIPVLVYLFHVEPTLATGYSLIVVGTTSLVGGVRSAFNKMVDFRVAFLFSIPSSIAIYLTRHYFLPRIPDILGTVGQVEITKNLATMIFFSLIMFIAALKMIRNKPVDVDKIHSEKYHLVMITIQGLVVGVVTGIAGAGGGFLIIPALVLLAGLPMKRAVGTSLIVIAINSLMGTVGDIGSDSAIDYPFILQISSLAIGGVFFGIYLSRFFNGIKLRAGFGWFAMVMAIFIIGKELFV